MDRGSLAASPDGATVNSQVREAVGVGWNWIGEPRRATPLRAFLNALSRLGEKILLKVLPKRESVPAAPGAPTPRGLVRVIDGKSLAHGAVLEVDGGSVQMQGELLPRYYRDAVLLVSGVDIRIEISIEPQRILQTATATTANPHPQHGAGFQFLRFHEVLNFVGCSFGQRDSHLFSLLAM